jgi:anti-sigma B factor antagonist
MQIDVRQLEGVTILEPHGRITLGAAEEELRDAVRSALDGPNKDILMNLEHVPIIDSAGIGLLLASRTTAMNRGGSLKLLRLPPAMHDLLQAIHLLTIFEVYDDEDDALASFAPSA